MVIDCEVIIKHRPVCHFDEGEITQEIPHRKSPIFIDLRV